MCRPLSILNQNVEMPAPRTTMDLVFENTYVMVSDGFDFRGIVHVKLESIAFQKKRSYTNYQ